VNTSGQILSPITGVRIPVGLPANSRPHETIREAFLYAIGLREILEQKGKVSPIFEGNPPQDLPLGYEPLALSV